MYKLLPDEEKQRVAEEYGRRRSVVILTAFIFLIMVAMMELFPSYVLSDARQKEVLERVIIVGDVGLKEGGPELQSWLRDFNQRLQILSPKLDSDRPSTIIENVLEERGVGIKLTNFNWQKLDGKIILSISGVAQDRQDLIDFEDRLNTSGHFETVTLPLSNLA